VGDQEDIYGDINMLEMNRDIEIHSLQYFLERKRELNECFDVTVQKEL